MARELRVSIAVPLPEGIFEEADLVSKTRSVVTVLQEDIANLGVKGAVVEVDIVTPKPRGAKDETPPVRGLTAAEAERRPEAA